MIHTRETCLGQYLRHHPLIAILCPMWTESGRNPRYIRDGKLIEQTTEDDLHGSAS